VKYDLDTYTTLYLNKNYLKYDQLRDFYYSLRGQTYPLVISIVTDLFSKLGYTNLNSIFYPDSLTELQSNNLLDKNFFDGLFEQRLDGFIVNIPNNFISPLLSGNYLLSDLLTLDSSSEYGFILSRKNDFVREIAKSLSGNSSLFKDYCSRLYANLVVSNKIDTDVLIFILYSFLSECKESTRDIEIIRSMYKGYLDRFSWRVLSELKFIGMTLDNVDSDIKIISRFSLMSITNQGKWVRFLSDLRGSGKMTDLVDMLDIL
jgi:hypothetical protein